jgi:hypothetical protein
MSPMQTQMWVWIDTLIQIQDILLLRKDESDMFGGYKEAQKLAKEEFEEVKRDVFTHKQFELMKQVIGGKK